MGKNREIIVDLFFVWIRVFNYFQARLCIINKYFTEKTRKNIGKN